MGEQEHKIVILANGAFPLSDRCRRIIDDAAKIICCDEAADHLVDYGKEPDVIIGDMDSLSEESKERYQPIIITIEEQDTNDLTKAVNYCVEKGFKAITILGATGLREDHTLGNISLLLEYNRTINARIITDYGEFSTLNSGEEVRTHPGEKISFFSVDNRVRVTSRGLRFPLNGLALHNWWRASLNEATEETFMLEFESEWPLLLYRLRG